MALEFLYEDRTSVTARRLGAARSFLLAALFRALSYFSRSILGPVPTSSILDDIQPDSPYKARHVESNTPSRQGSLCGSAP
jgi:hypothetical protein